MTASQLATRIAKSWERTRPVFARGNNSKGINAWIDLVRIIAAGPQGIPMQQFRSKRNSGRLRQQLDKWESAGLVILWHQIGDLASNGRRRLRIRATPKAITLLQL